MTADSGLDGVQGDGARDRKDQHAKGVKCHQKSCSGGWFRLKFAGQTSCGERLLRPRANNGEDQWAPF